MKLAHAILAATLVSGVVLACGGSSSSVEDGPVTTQTLEAIAGSYCDRINVCFGDFFMKAFIGDVATCKSRLQIELDASITGAGVQIKDSAAANCKAAVDLAACNTLLANGVTECDFRGTLADGAACASDSQCLSGACFVDAKSTCGKCAQRVPEGDDCTSAPCVRGLACTDAKKCAKPGAEGATCDSTSACELSLTCIANKCGKGLAKGAACKTTPNQTPCDTFTGVFCKPPTTTAADGTCEPFTTVSAGQACGVTLTPTVDFAFCQSSQCIGASGATKGTCQVFLADGSACDATTTPACAFPAKCRSGKCATLDPTVCK